MLSTRSFTAAAMLLVLAGCEQSMLDYRNAELSNGMIYEANENKPFTGLVTNLPGSALPADRAMNNFIGRTQSYMTPLERRSHAFNLASVVCDSDVKNGDLTGVTSCYTPNSRTKRFTAVYSESQLDGNAEVYAADGSTYIYKGAFRAGEAHGRQEFYKLSTGELLERSFAVDGKLDGLHERWDVATGALVYRAEADNGTFIGTAETWRNDGLKLSETPWVGGMVQGTFRTWDKDTGNLSEESTFVSGVRQGPIKLWRSDGTLSSEGIMRPDGILERASASDHVGSHPPSEDCVDLWIEAFREDVGEEALINNEQLSEWSSWCDNGQRP